MIVMRISRLSVAARNPQHHGGSTTCTRSDGCFPERLMARRKIVIAMMMHETNTFSPVPTSIESFARMGAMDGPAAIAELTGTNTQVGGFIGVAREIGAEFTVPMAASANPSGL